MCCKYDSWKRTVFEQMAIGFGENGLPLIVNKIRISDQVTNCVNNHSFLAIYIDDNLN